MQAQQGMAPSTSQRHGMRGLEQFIASIRRAPSREREAEKVRKELAKIRKKFTVKSMSGYDRRKYVAKLLYLAMLGYDIDFGLKEAVVLMGGSKFQEKLMGYLAANLILFKTPTFVDSMLSQIRADLNGEHEFIRGLALNAVANIVDGDVALELMDPVSKIMFNKGSKSSVKKKSAAAVLRLYRCNRDLCPADPWAKQLVDVLGDTDVGVLSSALALCIEIVRDSGGVGFEALRDAAVGVLKKMILDRDYTKDYVYYNIACPWVQVKALRLLQLFDPVEPARRNYKELTDVLRKMLNSADVAKGQSWNHKNSLNSVVFEAINLVIHNDNEKAHTAVAVQLLGRYLSNKHTNVRYLALVGLERLSGLQTATGVAVNQFEKVMLEQSVYDDDVSIRQRALDVLYGMASEDNARRIVNALVRLLEQPGAASTIEFREALVFKIAILAEKFCAGRFDWYVTVMLRVIELAGDFVADAVWYRVVAVVTNYSNTQALATGLAWDAIRRSGHLAIGIRETLVKVVVFLIGEFGHLICRRSGASPREQFDVLRMTFFPHVSEETRALILSAFIKMAMRDSTLVPAVQQAFVDSSTVVHMDIQQRACEYLRMLGGSKNVQGLDAALGRRLLAQVCAAMPSYANLEKEHSRFLSADAAAAARSPAPISNVIRPSGSDNSGSLLDLSDDDSASSALASSAPAKSSSVLDGLEALFGSNTSVSDNAAVMPSEPLSDLLSGLTVSTSGSGSGHSSVDQSDEQLDKLALVDHGVLHETADVQIGFRADYKDQFGRVLIFVGNRSQNEISSVSLRVDAGSSGIAWTVAQDPAIGQTICAGEQAKQLLLFQADEVGQSKSLTEQDKSGDVPTNPRLLLGGDLTLTYTHSGQIVVRRLALPIHICKFMTPLPLDGPRFFQKWGGFASSDAQSVVHARGGAIELDEVRATFCEGLKLKVLSGVDPNPNNLVAAGVVSTTSTGTQEVLVRLESNAQARMYRLTVRAGDQSIAHAVMHVIARHVGQPAA